MKQMRADVAHGGTAAERHGALQFIAQQLQGVGHALFATGGKPIQAGTTQGAGVRTQGQRLEYVRATANAAIDNYFKMISERFANTLDTVHGCHGAIELTAPVV
jgi:hypothetical protein